VTLVEDVRKLQRDQAKSDATNEELQRELTTLKEQINGKRGMSAAIDTLTTEVRGLRKAAYWVAGVIITAAISFAFTTMTLIP
jgi:hypothetical protein